MPTSHDDITEAVVEHGRYNSAEPWLHGSTGKTFVAGTPGAPRRQTLLPTTGLLADYYRAARAKIPTAMPFEWCN
jgi:hypothetical protein